MALPVRLTISTFLFSAEWMQCCFAGLLITKRSPATVKGQVSLCACRVQPDVKKGCVIVKQLTELMVTIGKLSLGNAGRKRAFIWCNREVNFYFPPVLLFLFFSWSVIQVQPACFLDVSCYFKIVTNQRRFAPRQAAFMMNQTILCAAER